MSYVPLLFAFLLAVAPPPDQPHKLPDKLDSFAHIA